MNREEIIRMAREAGFRDTTTPVVALGVSWEQVQRFATLVAAHEREAVIAIVNDNSDSDGVCCTDDLLAAIRARGEK